MRGAAFLPCSKWQHRKPLSLCFRLTMNQPVIELTFSLWLVSGTLGSLLSPLTPWKLWGWRWWWGSWWWGWWWLPGWWSGTGPLGEKDPGLGWKKYWSICGLGEKLLWCWCWWCCWWKPLLSVWGDILNCTPGWRFKKTILMSPHHDF